MIVFVVLIAITLVFAGVGVWGMRRFGVVLAFAPMALGVVLAAGAYFLQARSSERQRFAGVSRTYAADSGAWKQWPGTVEPVIRGKLLVVDAERKALHKFHFQLPKELRPAGPAEVGTVAVQRCTRTLVGRYGKSSAGYRWSCRIELLDLKAQTSYLSQTFDGSMPAKQSYTGDQTGGMPTAALWAFLTGLPRTNKAPETQTPSTDSIPMLSPI